MRGRIVKLKGKVAAMTGGEGPLGRVMCQKFLAAGASLVISWYASQEWEDAKSLIGGYQGQFIDVQVDASKEDQVSELMKKAKDTFGSIDMLLHVVGMYYSGNMIWETDSFTYERLMEVNLKSAFLASKYALRYMLEKGKGRIILFPATNSGRASAEVRCLCHLESRVNHSYAGIARGIERHPYYCQCSDAKRDGHFQNEKNTSCCD